MHLTSSKDGDLYIIRSLDGSGLNELIPRISASPEIELINVIGPADTPHTAVVRTHAGMAAALDMQFRASRQFSIEPDRPLSLFGKA